jgi:hypothetical protein
MEFAGDNPISKASSKLIALIAFKSPRSHLCVITCF